MDCYSANVSVIAKIVAGGGMIHIYEPSCDPVKMKGPTFVHVELGTFLQMV